MTTRLPADEKAALEAVRELSDDQLSELWLFSGDREIERLVGAEFERRRAALRGAKAK
jgi:hypothetical protein